MRDRKREIVRENAKEPHNEERVSGKTYMMAIISPTLQACKRHLQMLSCLEVLAA
jgi:hypothetical protein